MEALILSVPDSDKNNDITKFCENLTLDEINAIYGKMSNVYHICKEVYDRKYKAALDEGFPRYSELPRDIKKEILTVYPKDISQNYYINKESKELLSVDYANAKCFLKPTKKEIRKYIQAGNNVVFYKEILRFSYKIYIDNNHRHMVRYRRLTNTYEISDKIELTKKRRTFGIIDYLSQYNIINGRPICRYLPNPGKKYIIDRLNRDYYEPPLNNFVRLAANLHAFGIQDISSFPKSFSLDEMLAMNEAMNIQLEEFIKKLPD